MVFDSFKKILLAAVFILPVIVFLKFAEDVIDNNLKNLNQTRKNNLSSISASLLKRSKFENYFENLARSVKNALYWKLDIAQIIKRYQESLNPDTSINVFSIFLFDSNGKRVIKDWTSKDYIKASELVYKLLESSNYANDYSLSSSEKKLISSFIGDIKFVTHIAYRKNQIIDFGEKGIPILFGFYSAQDYRNNKMHFIIKVDYTKIDLPYFLNSNISKVISQANKNLLVKWAVIDIESKSVISPPKNYQNSGFIQLKHINEFFSKLPDTEYDYENYFVKTLILHNKYFIILLVEQLKNLDIGYFSKIIKNKFWFLLFTFAISFITLHLSSRIFITLKVRILVFFIFATSISTLVLWHCVILYKNTIIESLVYDKFFAMQKLLEKIDRNYVVYEDKVANTFIKIINKQNAFSIIKSIKRYFKKKKCKSNEYLSVYVFDNKFNIVYKDEASRQTLAEIWGNQRLENLKLIAKALALSVSNPKELESLISAYDYDFERKVAISSGIEFTRFISKIGEFRAAENKIKILPYVVIKGDKSVDSVVFIFFEHNSLYRSYQKIISKKISKMYKSEIIFTSILKPEIPQEFSAFSIPFSENELFQLTTDSINSNTFKSDIIRYKADKYAVTAYPAKLMEDYVLVLISSLNSINNTAKKIIRSFYIVVIIFFMYVIVIIFLLFRILLTPVASLEQSIRILQSGCYKIINMPNTQDVLQDIAKGISIIMEEQRNIKMAQIIQEQLYPQKLSIAGIQINCKNISQTEFIDELYDHYLLPDNQNIMLWLACVKANIVSSALLLCFCKAIFNSFIKLAQKSNSEQFCQNLHLKILDYMNKKFSDDMQLLKEIKILVGVINIKNSTLILHSRGDFACATLDISANENQRKQLCYSLSNNPNEGVIYYNKIYNICNEEIIVNLPSNCEIFIFGYNLQLIKIDSKILLHLIYKNA